MGPSNSDYWLKLCHLGILSVQDIILCSLRSQSPEEFWLDRTPYNISLEGLNIICCSNIIIYCRLTAQNSNVFYPVLWKLLNRWQKWDMSLLYAACTAIYYAYKWKFTSCSILMENDWKLFYHLFKSFKKVFHHYHAGKISAGKLFALWPISC